MAYSEFAYLYDDLNAEADYDALAGRLVQCMRQNGILDGIVADLGCGTGEVSLRLAAEGYDLVSIDASEDMLAVFREKLAQQPGAARNILLLRQRLEQLDLYGTIRAAVCTFDTLNHLPQQALQEALRRISLFMEPGGLLLFDANTPYKHREILANNSFTLEEDGLCFRWQNRYLPGEPGTEICVQAHEDGEELFCEQFMEYEYEEGFWRKLLARSGFMDIQVEDGEGFEPLKPESQRFLFCARKA